MESLREERQAEVLLGLLRDQKLVYGDNQLLFEVESLDQPLNFYFIHAGGSWFFKGLSGYVV